MLNEKQMQMLPGPFDYNFLVYCDFRPCGRESFCGTLCYVGCDFIIINVNIRHRCLSLHIPIKMIRFIAPYK